MKEKSFSLDGGFDGTSLSVKERGKKGNY